MSKNLILLTRRFPYHNKEAFLETEILYLSKFYDKITIFPSEVTRNKRTLPVNVFADESFSVVFKKKVERALVAFFSPSFYRTLWKHRLDITQLSDVFLIFKFTAGMLCYKKFFKNKVLENDATVYTYWLNEAAHAFTEIKRENSGTFHIVSRAHRYDIYEGLTSTNKFWPLRAETLSNIDAVFPISIDGSNYLNKGSVYTNKLHLARLGVIDRGLINPISIEGSLNIISVSRMHPMKRVDLIFESLCKFAAIKSNLSIHWTHFGGSDDYEKIIDLITSSSKPKNLFCNLPGDVLNSAVYDFYSISPVDLFVNLSESEGIPVSIMEALSFGIPIVATNVGGTSEIVFTEKNGILLNSNPSLSEITNAYEKIIQWKLNKENVKSIFKQYCDASQNYLNFCNKLKEVTSSQNRNHLHHDA